MSDDNQCLDEIWLSFKHWEQRIISDGDVTHRQGGNKSFSLSGECVWQ